MEDLIQFAPLRSSLASAHSILVVLPKEPNFDQVSAGLAFFLSLVKMGKSVSIVSPQEMTVEFSSLVGVDKVKIKPEGRNLTISFDYVEDSIEKVSYNIEGGKFNLVVQPKEGFSPLATDKVRYSYSGGKTDLILAIEVSSFKNLGSLYEDNNQLFDGGKVVNINLDGSASVSEKVTKLIFSFSLPVDIDIANNLLRGIENATDNFSSPETNADTFEAAAFCLRWGAQRIITGVPSPTKLGRRTPSKPMPSRAQIADFPTQEDKKPAEEVPSPDWLEPKIYRGNTQV